MTAWRNGFHFLVLMVYLTSERIERVRDTSTIRYNSYPMISVQFCRFCRDCNDHWNNKYTGMHSVVVWSRSCRSFLFFSVAIVAIIWKVASHQSRNDYRCCDDQAFSLNDKGRQRKESESLETRIRSLNVTSYNFRSPYWRTTFDYAIQRWNVISIISSLKMEIRQTRSQNNCGVECTTHLDLPVRDRYLQKIVCPLFRFQTCLHVASVLFYLEPRTNINYRLFCTQAKYSWLLTTYGKQVK